MNITCETLPYPNGTKYIRIRNECLQLGHVQIVTGGYLAPNKRKPVATIQEAVRQIITGRIDSNKKEIERLSRLLPEIENIKVEGVNGL